VRRFSFANPAGINALDNAFPRYNGAPSQPYPIIIVEEFAMGSTMFVSGRWGFVTKTGDWSSTPDPYAARHALSPGNL
jgi:putative SOS response-associated peptidase YedK